MSTVQVLSVKTTNILSVLAKKTKFKPKKKKKQIEKKLSLDNSLRPLNVCLAIVA